MTKADTTYSEALRPQVHFSSKRGWLNDPNGLVYFDGEYHLFYQHNPSGTNWGNLHWGHAVSADLVTWEELQSALAPDDLGMIFSGCIVIDHRNSANFQTGSAPAMIALYTTCIILADREVQQQCLAFSNDKGRTWTKYDGNPIIPDQFDDLGTHHTRDPNVFWHEASQKWIMLLFEKIGNSIYSSNDLISWRHESHTKTFWECPELFELLIDGDPTQAKWIMHGASGDYLIGNFDGKQFIPEHGLHNYTQGAFFAGQTFENIPPHDGRRIQIGWGTIESPNMLFNKMMTFPTTLTLRNTVDGPRLFNEPVAEIQNLNKSIVSMADLSLEEANHTLSTIGEGPQHIRLEIENVSALGYTMHIGDDELRWEIRSNTFCGYKYLPELGTTRMRIEIIVDRTSIEAYLDGGRFTCVITRNLLDAPRGDGYSLTTEGEFAKIKIARLEIFGLKSAWNNLKTTSSQK